MPALTAEQMLKISEKKRAQKNALERLITKPFDLNDDEQMQQFRTQVQHFELSLNRMYAFQAMADLMKVWGGSWVWAMMLPIPDSIKVILNFTLYVGVTGWVLSNFNSNDFHQELQDMKILYNWALKGSSERYDDSYDNEQILQDATVQQMVQFMAPLCSTEEMIAWASVSDGTVTRSWKVVQAVQWTASWFGTTQPAPSSVDAKVQALKEKVERQAFRTGVIEGLKQSLEYFGSNPNFRSYVSQEALRVVEQPFDRLKEALPKLLESGTAKPKLH